MRDDDDRLTRTVLSDEMVFIEQTTARAVDLNRIVRESGKIGFFPLYCFPFFSFSFSRTAFLLLLLFFYFEVIDTGVLWRHGVTRPLCSAERATPVAQIYRRVVGEAV